MLKKYSTFALVGPCNVDNLINPKHFQPFFLWFWCLKERMSVKLSCLQAALKRVDTIDNSAVASCESMSITWSQRWRNIYIDSYHPMLWANNVSISVMMLWSLWWWDVSFGVIHPTALVCSAQNVISILKLCCCLDGHLSLLIRGLVRTGLPQLPDAPCLSTEKL